MAKGTEEKVTEQETKESEAETLKTKEETSTVQALTGEQKPSEQQTVVLQSPLSLGDKAFYDEHDYAKAVEGYRTAIETAKDEYIKMKATYMMAESYVKLGQIEEAIKTFELLAKDHKAHYLKASAKRRIESLKRN